MCGLNNIFVEISTTIFLYNILTFFMYIIYGMGDSKLIKKKNVSQENGIVQM